MSEKESKVDEQETKQPALHVTKGERRERNKEVTAKFKEKETGMHRPRGKKQRREFKLDPNRG
jgi:hypothetical protein